MENLSDKDEYQKRNILKDKINMISERQYEHRDPKYFNKSMTYFADLIQRHDLEIQEPSILMSPKTLIKDIKEEFLNSTKEVMINTMKMNKINISSAIILYDYNMEFENNKNIVIFNSLIYLIFINYIENILLTCPKNHFFKKEKLKEFFGDSLYDKLKDLKVILTKTKEIFTINSFIDYFREFASFIEETIKNKDIDDFQKNNHIYNKFIILLDKPKTKIYLYSTINLFIISYLKNLIDKDNKVNLQKIQCNNLDNVTNMLLSLYGFRYKPSFQLLQLMSNLLNIELNYLDLNEFTPNLVTIFPFCDINYDFPLIRINVSSDNRYYLYFILYEKKFELLIQKQLSNNILTYIQKYRDPKKKNKNNEFKRFDIENAENKACVVEYIELIQGLSNIMSYLKKSENNNQEKILYKSDIESLLNRIEKLVEFVKSQICYDNSKNEFESYKMLKELKEINQNLLFLKLSSYQENY